MLIPWPLLHKARPGFFGGGRAAVLNLCLLLCATFLCCGLTAIRTDSQNRGLFRLPDLFQTAHVSTKPQQNTCIEHGDIDAPTPPPKKHHLFSFAETGCLLVTPTVDLHQGDPVCYLHAANLTHALSFLLPAVTLLFFSLSHLPVIIMFVTATITQICPGKLPPRIPPTNTRPANALRPIFFWF